jgi:hypothetical protein
MAKDEKVEATASSICCGVEALLTTPLEAVVTVLGTYAIQME